MGQLEPRTNWPKVRVLLAGILTAGVGLGILLATAASNAPARPQAAATNETKSAAIVIFVRHAEKDPSGDPKDPGLAEAGRARAKALARLLAHAGVNRLFASEYRRTQETLAPLSESTGRKVEILPAADSGRLIAALSSLPPGSVSVVAGHSNTIPGVIEKLGGHLGDLVSTPQGPELRESEFDRLFVLTLGPPEKSGEHVSHATVSTLELRYGD